MRIIKNGRYRHTLIHLCKIFRSNETIHHPTGNAEVGVNVILEHSRIIYSPDFIVVAVLPTLKKKREVPYFILFLFFWEGGTIDLGSFLFKSFLKNCSLYLAFTISIRNNDETVRRWKKKGRK